MKSFLTLLSMATCSFIISCNSGGMSATAKKNIEVNEAITKSYETGDFSKIADYIAADAIDHGGEHGDVKGLDSIVASLKRYHEMMPDMKSTIKKTMADDEYVFTWSTVSGTMNGQKSEMTSVDVVKFKDGKAVEHWLYMDPAEMAKMMMQPATPPAADTAMMKQGTKPADTAVKK
jgi:predicted SnoaL-like aldol condensation-catalyzing enzyme